MFKFKRKIGPKGQVVLPKDIRENLGLRTGTEVVFYLEKEQVIIEPVKDPIEYLEEFCTLPEGTKKIKLTPKEIKESYEEGYEKKFKKLRRGT